MEHVARGLLGGTVSEGRVVGDEGFESLDFFVRAPAKYLHTAKIRPQLLLNLESTISWGRANHALHHEPICPRLSVGSSAWVYLGRPRKRQAPGKLWRHLPLAAVRPFHF